MSNWEDAKKAAQGRRVVVQISEKRVRIFRYCCEASGCREGTNNLGQSGWVTVTGCCETKDKRPIYLCKNHLIGTYRYRWLNVNTDTPLVFS